MTTIFLIFSRILDQINAKEFSRISERPWDFLEQLCTGTWPGQKNTSNNETKNNDSRKATRQDLVTKWQKKSTDRVFLGKVPFRMQTTNNSLSTISSPVTTSSRLLPDNIRAQEIEPQTFLEGKLVVSGSKKRVIEIADIVTWIEAFTIFSMILCHTFLSCWKDLNQYKLLIIQTAGAFLTDRGSTTTSPSEKKPSLLAENLIERIKNHCV